MAYTKAIENTWNDPSRISAVNWYNLKIYLIESYIYKHNIYDIRIVQKIRRFGGCHVLQDYNAVNI